MADKLRLAVFASHGGTDLQSIIDAAKDEGYPAGIVLMVSNNKIAFAVERAKNANIPTVIWQRKKFEDDQAYTDYMVNLLEEYEVDLICLAGYMKLIPSEIVRKFKIINIHPALLPKYGGKGMYGMHVHEAVLEAGERTSGATVHQVNEKYDEGKILAQWEVPVKEDDTPETLQKRVLETEHKLYPDTIAKIARGEIKLNG
ncbi:MAG: phosphoribosylglycinamide formyltransferase [candidate division Zixibacteria bacterium]|nr:phosphoribosylglycinamide formyltransferase [candidate division Zixibacteria bacterium]NIR63257.1 phosphoribosylglycinamide formyltransferase [candidate division Zixibacteria bacterium]NIS17117.1 phosphoribosylglycinamide formyltransferase [candidate division Zixibacteria bacterium]NIS45238.1 phosphoribosylglycinamide formyltransferase [candidate division Zixibacteria bacterium]NIT53469.1 phosphoribosylglycinamide formyltransferase [candidate division Zixibacteria bacterium]